MGLRFEGTLVLWLELGMDGESMWTRIERTVGERWVRVWA